uniref:Uncharacterized protein n=1 Tax=Oryza sativa subsp. japonica TaxID=39947 RepID=Q8H494_ORYSJ|nr:hypothetical protein [Oryza sativa Japonica Group]BAD32036.1 hypothetical protein [Oryza sativa Japonica Group]
MADTGYRCQVIESVGNAFGTLAFTCATVVLCEQCCYQNHIVAIFANFFARLLENDNMT